jgi:hypothetical protein
LSSRTRRKRYTPDGHDAVVRIVTDVDQFEQSTRPVDALLAHAGWAAPGTPRITE